MNDKNNVVIEIGDIVKIENSPIKSDNAVYVVAQDGTSKNYTGKDLTLYKVAKHKGGYSLSRSSYNICFYPLHNYSNKYSYTREEMNAATIEVLLKADNTAFKLVKNDDKYEPEETEQTYFKATVKIGNEEIEDISYLSSEKEKMIAFFSNITLKEGETIDIYKQDYSWGYYNRNIKYKLESIKQQEETTTEKITDQPEKTNSNSLHYDINEDIDTRDNSKIFVVKVKEKLSKDEYIKVNNNIKSIGGYYSKFKHGFIFKEDPTEILNGCNNTEYEKTSEEKEQVKQDQKQSNKNKLTEKINKQIDSIQKKIDGLSGDYKTNTWKRMNEQASRDSKIEGFKNDIELLQYLLDTLENRDLTPLEENLIISSFRAEIYSYYIRHNAYLEKKGTALKEISFPEIDRQYPDSWMNKEVPTKQKRLQKANIYNTNDLIKAVDEYKVIYDLINKPCNYTEKKIKQLEREYKMQQKGDINFTPLKVVEQLISYAHIDENSRVLEPSAGIGNIADQIKQITNNLDVCEQMYHFSELLKLKGHNVVGNDFLEYQTSNKYDAIIMNPPFSDEQNHIKHAYDLLKDDGILVAISSPHWTFANDKKSIEFRQWLENETYFTEDLKSGTFEMTGVASKIIVIEKHEQAETKTA